MEKIRNKWWGRIAILSVALLFLVAAIVGMTMSKYVKNATNGDETGSVAKFGIVMNWSSGVFNQEYTKDDTNSDYASITNSVNVGAGNKGLAPGTKGDSTLSFTGTSQVAFALTLDFSGCVAEGWTVTEGAYNPIVFSIINANNEFLAYDDQEDEYGWTSYSAENEIQTYTFAEVKLMTAAPVLIYEPTGAAINVPNIVVRWSWPFSTSTANDAKDTELAELDPSPTLKLSLKATATQID